MTLVEVVAGIALLALLLVLILLSFREHAAQIREAKFRAVAMREADSLLSAWTASGSIPAVGDEQEIVDHPGWQWRIVSVPGREGLSQIGAGVVRLEIVSSSDVARVHPLATVELVVPSAGGITN